jgi:CheY-like chemotaxis protein
MSSKKTRVLVIDDNAAILANIRSTLETAGYDVVATSQTVGTARHLKGCNLVILDYHMPGLDGGSVLSSLKAAAASAQSKPLFYLYTSDTQLQATATTLGFDGAFTEKGNREALVRQVDSVVRLLRLRALQNT